MGFGKVGGKEVNSQQLPINKINDNLPLIENKMGNRQVAKVAPTSEKQIYIKGNVLDSERRVIPPNNDVLTLINFSKSKVKNIFSVEHEKLYLELKNIYETLLEINISPSRMRRRLENYIKELESRATVSLQKCQKETKKLFSEIDDYALKLGISGQDKSNCESVIKQMIERRIKGLKTHQALSQKSIDNLKKLKSFEFKGSIEICNKLNKITLSKEKIAQTNKENSEILKTLTAKLNKSNQHEFNAVRKVDALPKLQKPEPDHVPLRPQKNMEHFHQRIEAANAMVNPNVRKAKELDKPVNTKKDTMGNQEPVNNNRKINTPIPPKQPGGHKLSDNVDLNKNVDNNQKDQLTKNIVKATNKVHDILPEYNQQLVIEKDIAKAIDATIEANAYKTFELSKMQVNNSFNEEMIRENNIILNILNQQATSTIAKKINNAELALQINKQRKKELVIIQSLNIKTGAIYLNLLEEYNRAHLDSKFKSKYLKALDTKIKEKIEAIKDVQTDKIEWIKKLNDNADYKAALDELTLAIKTQNQKLKQEIISNNQKIFTLNQQLSFNPQGGFGVVKIIDSAFLPSLDPKNGQPVLRKPQVLKTQKASTEDEINRCQKESKIHKISTSPIKFISQKTINNQHHTLMDWGGISLHDFIKDLLSQTKPTKKYA